MASPASKPADPGPWECRARPAPSGKPCGHLNASPTVFQGLVCCSACGCTKHASDDRARRERLANGTAPRLERDALP